ncbi:ABC transporter ATP-binding protein/permease [Fictibacillus sp. KIGAM418]|uniref:ABC transporter ATP-binding protein/permease n=1 Tax=Fictibacillus marinisediminis TaxID=2878389 RepID=A0A9X2BF86_9BACL|nr:ABC transporter ATP-binding protein [Fictibacillus marinisediminis]MCK6259466.1 ABC transporter ATP-binding protein/permease [Fictibacillus marinisediminis]
MELIKIYKHYLTKRTLLYSLAFVFLLASEILNVIPPKIIGNLIDEIEKHHLTRQGLFQGVLPLFGIALLHYIVIYIWSSSLFGGEFFIQKVLRQSLFSRTLNYLPLKNKRSGNTMTLMNTDISNIGVAYGFGILSFMSTVIGFGVVLFTMSTFVSWKLTLASLVPMPFIIYFVKKLGEMTHRKTVDFQSKESALNADLSVFLEGIRLIRIYSLEHVYKKKINDANRRWKEAGIDFNKTAKLYQPMVTTLLRTSYAIAIGYGAYLISVDELTIGQLIAFTMYINLLNWPVTAFGDFINLFQQGNASASRFNRELSSPPRKKQDQKMKSVDSISFEKFNLKIDGITRLENIDLYVNKGETIAVVGKTGSGKSSLLQYIAGELKGGEGKSLLSNVAVETLSQKELSAVVSYCPQHPANLSKNILQNVKLGNPEATEEQVSEVLSISALDEELKKSNLSVESVIGGNGKNLSGGQHQKLSLARAILKECDLLLLDDVFSSMDAENSLRIFTNLMNARKGTTIIFATNNLEQASVADRIVVLMDGKIVESGSHQSLMEAEKWYAKQYSKSKQLTILNLEEGRENQHD